jgi:predicted HAD superfamily phosphohydrolase
MRYGLEISAAGACGDARTLADLAQLVEEAGWDGVFLEDYITDVEMMRAAIRRGPLRID